MPRCKHKMYCVCFFLKVAGQSWLLIRQEIRSGRFCSNELLFVRYREEIKGKKIKLKLLHTKSNTVVKETKQKIQFPLDYHIRRFYFFAVYEMIKHFFMFFFFFPFS